MIKKLILILIISILWNNVVVSQVLAKFTTIDSVGCNSLVVHFNNESQGDNLTFKWDFGNGMTSILTSPQVVYNQVGSYSVSLIAYNQNERDTLLKENYVVINASPVIKNIITTNELGCLPLETDFTAIVDTGNSPINTAIWDFGDGNSSIQNQPQYTYLDEGKFTVSLFISDTNKCESNFSIEELITTIALPSIKFSSNQNVACVDTLTVAFNNLSVGASAMSYMWNFGNGNESLQESPKQFYSGFDNYTVRLIGTDDFGCVDSLVKPNFVKLQELIVDINIADNYLCRYEELEINNNTQGANSFSWNFGDLTKSNLQKPQKQYKDTGNFQIEYIASFNKVCFDTIVTNIYVDPITAHFKLDNNYGCEFPFVVQYTDSSINASSWNWIFGDNTSSTLQQPLVNFEVTSELLDGRSIFLADTLIVESNMHCKDTFVIDSNIHLHFPSVYFTPNDSSNYKPLFTGCVPIDVDFQNKSESFYDDDPFVSWEWDFGDTTYSQLNNPDHSYNYAGEYNVMLSAISQSGCVNTYNAILLAGNSQDAKFSYSGNPVICGSEIAIFNNESSDELLVDAWKWLFTDGTKNENKNPSIQFQDTGYISGELTVFYNGCEGSTYKLDSFININGPAGGFKTTLNCNDPFTYQFSSNVVDADFWYFGFGDNYFDSTQNISVNHNYTNVGNYDMFLKAENETIGCTLLIEREIFVRDLVADYYFYPEKICPGDSVFFNPEKSLDNSYFVINNKVGKYLWNFDDNTDDEMGFGIQSHTFEKPGTYNVTLTVKDLNGCEQNITKKIKVNNINADFYFSDSIGCTPLSVDFFDSSVSDTIIEKWVWKFGNNTTDTNQNTNHIFSQDTSYNVMLIVTDIIGCSDTIIKQNKIYSSNPISKFSAEKVNNCFNDTVIFHNLSTGNLLKSFFWDFGNGTTSNEFEPRIPYSDTGFFDISLLVIDSLGCDSQQVKNEYLYVQPLPIADFSINSFSSTCYPKIIGFNDLSVSNDINYRLWDYGDNEINENEINPYHIYKKPGSYTVKLKVETTVGCSNTIIKNNLIKIGGPYADIITLDTACINLPINISFANALNVDKFVWTLGDGSSYSSNLFTKEYDTFGLKKIYLQLESDSVGTCSKMFEDSIIIPEIIANFNLSDTANCVPYTITTTNSSVGANIHQWFENDVFIDSSNNIELFLTTPGLHLLKLVSSNNAKCKDSTYKNIMVYPLPEIVLSKDSLICQYDSVWLQASGGVNYFWYDETNFLDSLVSTINVKPLVNTKFKIKVVDGNSCINFDSVNISVQPKPVVQILNSDTTLIIGEEIELVANYYDADYIEWEPSNSLSCINCNTTFSTPLESTKYTFNVSDNNNCFLVSDSVFIIVDAKYSLDVPTSFSPNGDGINDVLYVKGWGIKELTYFEIYDIAGRIVFKTNNIDEGWDGNSVLGKQHEGTYIYKAKVISFDNVARNKQGYIYLIK